jgi:hypothetical protein
MAKKSNGVITLGDRIDMIFVLRTQKAALEDQIKELNGRIGEVKAGILTEMQISGLEKAAGSKATAFIEIKFYPGVKDKETFYVWAVRNKKFEMLQARCNAAAVREYFESKNKLPDGLDSHTEPEIMVRRK